MFYTQKFCFTNLDEMLYDRPGQYNVVAFARTDQTILE